MTATNNPVESHEPVRTVDPDADGTPRVLCVDHDPIVLEGFRRNDSKKFRVQRAGGPGEALDLLRSKGPFAVVLTDYQMPFMDGVRFLSKARTTSPDTVRILLTGQADVAMAMAAVNQGNIFRFLLKPCAPMVLEKVLLAGIDHHRRALADRELLNEALLGCVQVLVELLSTVQPEAFSRAARLRRYVKQIVLKAGLAGGWRFEAAAMLCHIGWVTLPPDQLAKAASESYTEQERPLFEANLSTAARMLERIPRLDSVAQMIERQHIRFADLPEGMGLHSPDTGSVGAQLLKTVTAYDRYRRRDLRHEDALEKMRLETGAYMPEILEAMAHMSGLKAREVIEFVPLVTLAPGMFLEEDLRSKNGMMLLGKGQEVTTTFVERLMNRSYGLESSHLCKVRLLKGEDD